MSVAPRDLAPVVELVRRQVDHLDCVQIAVTWRTGDGEMTVDLRVDDYLRVEFTGDRASRVYALEPTWGTA